MSSRLLTAVLVVQSLLLTILVADRWMPEAHAAEATPCEIVNWPRALTGEGFDAIRVRVEEVRQPVPVDVKTWSSRDRVTVGVDDWSTSDQVHVSVRDWSTSDVVRTSP